MAKIHYGIRKWISDAVSHPGSVRRMLHVPEGKKVPISKINSKIADLKRQQALKRKRTGTGNAHTTEELRKLNLAKTLKKISGG